MVSSLIAKKASSTWPEGSQVRVSEACEKHEKFRGKVGEIVSYSSHWIKVELQDEDGEAAVLSFRQADLALATTRTAAKPPAHEAVKEAGADVAMEEAEGRKEPGATRRASPEKRPAKRTAEAAPAAGTDTARKKLKQPRPQAAIGGGSSSSGPIGNYPGTLAADDSKTLPPAVQRTLGLGDGAATSAAAGVYVGAVCSHEIDCVEKAISVRPEGGDSTSLVGLLRAVAASVAEACPEAVEEARQRRRRAAIKGRAKGLREELAGLEAEECAWTKLQAKQEAQEGQASETDEEAADLERCGEAAAEETGPGFDLVVNRGLGLRKHVESLTLGLDTMGEELRQSLALAREANLAEQALAAANKGRHLDALVDLPPPEARKGGRPEDAKDLIRKLAAAPK